MVCCSRLSQATGGKVFSGLFPFHWLLSYLQFSHFYRPKMIIDVCDWNRIYTTTHHLLCVRLSVMQSEGVSDPTTDCILRNLVIVWLNIFCIDIVPCLTWKQSRILIQERKKEHIFLSKCWIISHGRKKRIFPASPNTLKHFYIPTCQQAYISSPSQQAWAKVEFCKKFKSMRLFPQQSLVAIWHTAVPTQWSASGDADLVVIKIAES